MYYLGFDIGGTKCAAVVARYDGDTLEIVGRESLPTDLTVAPEQMLARLIALADTLLAEQPHAVGVSCGGPLNAERGVILSPPNLRGWDEVHAHYGVPVYLQNDADACALAEWRFGAGQGTRNMIFITFGTGFGTGLILGGRLYSGTSGNAGEAGHIRLTEGGPVGYGKAGSVEGYCSGGGIAQLARFYALEQMAETGVAPSYFNATDDTVSAKAVALAAREGDACALRVFSCSGEKLGHALSILMDVLNPERIVIGSIFARCRDLLWESAASVIEREALPAARSCCTVLPAALGEQIGDYGAITVALYREELL